MTKNIAYSKPRFDWYQVTFRGDYKPEEILQAALSFWDLSQFIQARPRVRQYNHAAEIKLGDRVIFHLCWGGCNSGVHLISTGQSSHEVYLWLSSVFPDYAVSRADVCLDTTDKGAFDHLVKFQSGFHVAHNITQDQQGDWDKPGSPSGRTFYLGSKKSGSQALTRTYEKGKQLKANPDWVRFEVEVRPQSSKSKEAVASMSPFEVLLSVKWVKRLVLDMFDMSAFQSMAVSTISTTWEATDDQRAFLALVSQYGKRLRQHAIDWGGWAAVGEEIGRYADILESQNKTLGGLGSNPYQDARSLNKSA